MDYQIFKDQIYNAFDSYLRQVSAAHTSGRINSGTQKILYPNILILTVTEECFIAELVGASPTYEGLIIKFHNEKSVYRYLNHFDESSENPLFDVGVNAGPVFGGLCLSHDVSFQEVTSRFPFVSLMGTRLVMQQPGVGIFRFHKDFKTTLIMKCCLVNSKDNIFRCKNILTVFMLNKKASRQDLQNEFQRLFGSNEVHNVWLVPNEQAESYIVAGHMQSLYLSPGMRETTIGEYINLHRQIVERALSVDSFLYEPSFDWCEHDGTVEDVAINPDLMIKRSDGNYDIYDLKTALLDRKRLTTSSRSRRRFMECVNEGIAQLANYREYFTYEANRAHAEERHNVRVSNPKLVLIIGS